MNMTDSEINEAVARKLGWTYFYSGAFSGWGKDALEPTQAQPNDYCHSIARAWDIVEKMPTFVVAKLSSGWAANPQPPGFLYLTKADTAPMAICLAFLKVEA